jgi:hypothetical protein
MAKKKPAPGSGRGYATGMVVVRVRYPESVLQFKQRWGSGRDITILSSGVVGERSCTELNVGSADRDVKQIVQVVQSWVGCHAINC